MLPGFATPKSYETAENQRIVRETRLVLLPAPTGENGVRPKAIALGTADLLEAINLSFSERDRFQFVAATVIDWMSPAIDLYLKEKLAGIHEGNFARYRIRPSEFEGWQPVWNETRV